VPYLWIILGVIPTAWLMDYMLRLYVAPRIADIFENNPPFDVSAESPPNAAELISIPTADGLTLTGSLVLPEFETPRGLVIFFPELNGNHAMSVRYCAGLLKAGFALLGFDFRNQGVSDKQEEYDPIHWITEYELRDVEAVMEYVESHPQLATLPIVSFGDSRGGVAAIIAAGRYPRVRAVIADSAFSTHAMTRHFVDRFAKFIIPQWLFRYLPEIHIRGALRDAMQISQRRRNCTYLHMEDELPASLNTPMLLISGLSDSYVRPDLARHVHRVCGDAAELWLVENAKHNKAREQQPEEYDRRVVDHVAQALPDAFEQPESADDASDSPLRADIATS